MATLSVILITAAVVLGVLAFLSRQQDGRPATSARSIVVVIGIAVVLVLAWMAVVVLLVGPQFRDR